MTYCSVNSNFVDQKDKFDQIFYESNGIIIFDFSKYKKIKLLCNFCSSLDLTLLWNKMTKGNFRFNKIQASLNNDDIDYYIIINSPLPIDKYDPKKTIVFRMEPDMDNNTNDSVKWDNWYLNKGLKKEDFMYFCDLNRYRNNTEWHLGSNYNQLIFKKIEKTKLLSSVVSSLYQMEGHKYRIDLLKYIESKDIKIDIYGRENLFSFKNYKGSLPSHNKDNGILPYKYTFISENYDRKNYVTEKLTDAILGETLCFYWGCSNVTDFYDERSFILLPNNKEKACNLIEKSILENEYEKRINYIRKEKEKILNYYNFFPRIQNLINISELYKIVYDHIDGKDLLFNDIKNYIITKDWKNNINKERNMLIINGKINTTHFNDKLAIVYSKVLEKEWDILILDNGNNKNNEYCEIIKINNKENNFKSFILNCKSLNKKDLIIYKTEDNLIISN
jgi:hypothetical protein